MTYKILEDDGNKINRCSYELNGVTYTMLSDFRDGKSYRLTEEEAKERAEQLEEARKQDTPRKLAEIKLLRLEQLKETDYLAMSDNVLSDEMKAFRKSMRDIPQDYSADKYDELLARDSDGKLTHTVWEKP